MLLDQVLLTQISFNFVNNNNNKIIKRKHMLNLLYKNSAFKDILYTFYLLKNLNFDKIKKEQLRLREN